MTRIGGWGQSLHHMDLFFNQIKKGTIQASTSFKSKSANTCAEKQQKFGVFPRVDEAQMS